MPSLTSLLAAFAAVAPTSAHLLMTYPGQRGNNLRSSHDNTTQCRKGYDDYSGDKGCFPYGMEWMYPCGGMTTTTNRTYWPVDGGAISFQPGWFPDHPTGFIYVNLGVGTIPPNMSHPMMPVLQISGPTNDEWPGRPICFPQVGMPANLSLQAGDNATIQIVLAARHGAALYTCADITLTNNMSQVEPVTPENCYNDSAIGINLIYTTVSLTNAAGGLASGSSPALFGILSLAAMVSAFTFAL